MKVIHTGDWHIGSPRSPYRDGVNLRSADTCRCLDKLVATAERVRPDYTLVSGDIFDVGKVWSDRCCSEIMTASKYIRALAMFSGRVVVMRGTPNHDGAAQIRVLSEMFADASNVDIVDGPALLGYGDVTIACVPGFDSGRFAAEHPDLSKEDRNAAITEELASIVQGFSPACDPAVPSILMAHYTVPGADINAGQTSMLAQFEPFITREALQAADYDLVALGHIHRPQEIKGIRNCYYCGGINTGNFNDEGQERGFWVHDIEGHCVTSEFVPTPCRELLTLRLDNGDITDINTGNAKEAAMRRWACGDLIKDKIVRVHYRCTDDNNKALDRAALSNLLLRDGAFMVWEILPEQVDEIANRETLDDATDPEENLILYLKEKDVESERINDLVHKARPVIQQAMAGLTTGAYTGVFEPVEIAVRNYRNYAEETFSFEDISFCTINGVNGSGKSSLFMDAIIDCLYEEPREGEKTGWIRNDPKARSGSIKFTFRIGEHTFRVARTRQRSGKGTLNVAELVDGEWRDRSCERYTDTQAAILDIIGMDSMTFRSCALIMQDQYGIFLQAAPEDRVKVLGTLLGLDAYRQMEKIASDLGHRHGAKKRDIAGAIAAHMSTIEGLGEPEAELAELEQDLETARDRRAQVQEMLDSKRAALASAQEASGRKVRLADRISSFDLKIDNAKEQLETQNAIVDAGMAVLSVRDEIERRAAERAALAERERSLAGEAALYASKLAEVRKLRERALDEEEQVRACESKLAAQEKKLAFLGDAGDEEALRKDAEEYERYGALLEEQNVLYGKYTDASIERADITASIRLRQDSGSAKLDALDRERSDLEKRAAMLRDSGCVDIEKAQCRFLADAKDARARIPEVSGEIARCHEQLNADVAALYEKLERKKEEMDAIGYDPGLRKEYLEKVGSLREAPAKLAGLERRKAEIVAVAASVESIQSIITSRKETLLQLMQDVKSAALECEAYQKSYTEHKKVQEELADTAAWEERAKELPLAEERVKVAKKRADEIRQEITRLDADKAEAVDEYLKISLAAVAAITAEVHSLSKRVGACDSAIEDAQLRIGALMQKREQIDAVSKQIAELRKDEMKEAKETADYDMLKMAFSPPGIPHQIIRSIVPALSSTANSILGQMTGGRMGVEFRLERMQKNGREKTALDIYIDEGSQAPLPYLSKSGGEKVKASLSVILALAEVKSSSVGVQMGFISIDEPPFLDDDGTQAYVDALETIQRRYPEMKVMAITHDPAMKARFPQSVDVIKTDEGSRIVF